MAQTQQRSYGGGANRGGMGSLFAGFMEGWDGVGQIFSDIDLMRKEQKFKAQADKQEAADKQNQLEGSTKLSTALLDSPDVAGAVQTTQTGATPYTGAKLAGTVAIPETAPAGGPSGTATPPTLRTGLKPPDGGDPSTRSRPTSLGYGSEQVTDTPVLPNNPELPGPNGPVRAGAREQTGPIKPAVGGGYPPPAVPAAAPAAAPAASADTPGPEEPGKESSSRIPSFGNQPAQPQSRVTEALPTGVGTTLGTARVPAYADASLGQSLLGLGATAGRRGVRGIGGLDLAEQQQAIATAPPAAVRPRPRVAAQQVIPTLLPQVDLFGNPIVPPGVRSV